MSDSLSLLPYFSQPPHLSQRVHSCVARIFSLSLLPINTLSCVYTPVPFLLLPFLLISFFLSSSLRIFAIMSAPETVAAPVAPVADVKPVDTPAPVAEAAPAVIDVPKVEEATPVCFFFCSPFISLYLQAFLQEPSKTEDKAAEPTATANEAAAAPAAEASAAETPAGEEASKEEAKPVCSFSFIVKGRDLFCYRRLPRLRLLLRRKSVPRARACLPSSWLHSRMRRPRLRRK